MPEDPNGLQGWALEDTPAADLGGWQLEDVPAAKPPPGPSASAIHVPVASTLGGAPKAQTPAFAKGLEGLTPEQAQAKADANLKSRQGLFAYAKSRGMSDEAALHAVNIWEPAYNQSAQIDPKYLPPGQMKVGPNTAEAAASAATVARQGTTASGRTFLGAMQGAGEAMADTLGFATSKIPKAIGTAFSAAGMDVAAQGMEQIGDRLAPEVPAPAGQFGKNVQAARATTEGQIAELAGGVGGTIPGLGVMGLKGIALKSATEAVDRAKQSGASDTTALLAGTLHGASFLAGGKAMELIPFSRTTSKAFAGTEAVGRDVAFFQTLGLAGNAIDKATFDPKREWDAGAKESLVQGVAWSLLRVPRAVKGAKIRDQAGSYKDGPFWYADDLERTARALESERTTINSKFAEGQIDQMQADLLRGAKVARDFGDAQNKALAKQGWKMGPAAGQAELAGPPPEPEGPRPIAGTLAGPAPELTPPDSGKATPIAGAPSSPQPGGPIEVEHGGTTYGLDPNSGQVYERLPDGTAQAAGQPPPEAVAKLQGRVEAVQSANLTQAEAAIHPYDWQVQKKAEAAQAEVQAPAPVTEVTESPAPAITHKQFQAGLPEELQGEFHTRLTALQDQPEAIREQITTLKSQMDALKEKVKHEVIAHWGEKGAKERTTEALNNLPAWDEMQQRMSDLLGSHSQAFQDHPAQVEALRGEFTERAGRRQEAAPVAEEHRQGQRRQDAETRKKVAEMTPEEMQSALLTDSMTGLGNRRAWEETSPKPVKASLDVDSLKWVNDTMGHEAGDALLKKMGEALHEAGMGQDAFHVSGDEFFAHGDTEDSLHASMAAADSFLAKNHLEFTLEDGSTVTIKAGFSYGIGRDIKEAETGLQSHKAERERTGQRAARGNEPPSVRKTPPERGGNQVREDRREGVPAQAPVAAEANKEEPHALQEQGSGEVGPHGGGTEGLGGEGGGGVRQGQQGTQLARTFPGDLEGEAPPETPAAPEAQRPEVPPEAQGEVASREVLVRVAKEAGAAVRGLVKAAVGTPIGTAKLIDSMDAGGDAATALAAAKNLEPFHVGEVQFQVKGGKPFLVDGENQTPLSVEEFSSMFQAERDKEATALKMLYSGVNVREAIKAVFPDSTPAHGENIGWFEGVAQLPSRLAQKRPETFGWVYEQIKRWDDQVKQHEASHVEPRRTLLGIKPEEAHRLGAFFAEARFEDNPDGTAALKDFHKQVESHWEVRAREAEGRAKSLEEAAKASPSEVWKARAKNLAAKATAKIAEYRALAAEAKAKADSATSRGHRYSVDELKAKGFSPEAAEAAEPYLQDFTNQIQELEDASRARAMLSKLRASVRLAGLETRLEATEDQAEAAKIEQEIADTEDSIDAAQWLANKYKEIRLTDTAYFPLHRKGEWGVKWMAEDKDGNPYLVHFILGDKRDMLRRAAEEEKLNPNLKDAGVKRSPVLNWKKDFIQTKPIPVSKIEKAALMAGLSEGVAEKLSYELETLDLENSYAGAYKAHLRKAKGIPGFETDPVAAHAQYTASAAKYRAHLLHTHEISRRIAELEGDRIGEDGVDWGVSKHKDDINYLKELAADVFVNPVSPFIARIQSLTAMSALGLNPAFMIQQGLQKLTHEEPTFAAIYDLADRTKAITTAFGLASDMAVKSGVLKLQGKPTAPWESITPDSLSLISDEPEVRDRLAGELQKVLRHAEEEGLFLDQVRQETQRQASGEDSALSRAQEKAERSVFSMVSSTENHNRRQTFIAQYLLARTVGYPVKPGLDAAMEPDKIGGHGPGYEMKVLSPKAAEVIAAKQVDWIHNRRGVTNRSKLQRSARGIFMPATQFKYFSIEYLQQMSHVLRVAYSKERQQGKGKTQAAMAASMPVARSMGWQLAAAGLNGIPFLTAMIELAWVVLNEVFGPLFKGENFRPQKHWRQAIRENMEKAGAKPWMIDMFFRGSPGAFAGVSMERSLGMGDVFQVNRGDSLVETGANLALGAAGQNVQQVARVVKKAREGSYAQAAASIPGVPKGVRQITTAFTDDKMKLGAGRNVPLTPKERSMRAVGLTPTRVAEARDIAANQNWESQNARERKDFFSKRIGKAFEDILVPATSKEGAADLSRLFGSLGSYNADMAMRGRINELVNPKDMKAPIRDVTGGTRKGVAFQQELVKRTKR